MIICKARFLGLKFLEVNNISKKYLALKKQTVYVKMKIVKDTFLCADGRECYAETSI